MCHKYDISVSKFCCPVCWELIKVLNETTKNVEFIVRAHHSNLYPVCLPSWLPNVALERMVQYQNFCQLRSVEPSSLSFSSSLGHNRNVSLESAGESVSSVGSADLKVSSPVKIAPSHI